MITNQKEERNTKMEFWDNDFDRMFDEAVEELERNQENIIGKDKNEKR